MTALRGGVQPVIRTPVVVEASAKPMLSISALQCADHPADEHCRYKVAWSINPHMAIGGVDFAQALVEHAALVAALEAAGAKVSTLPFVHGAFDSVFIKDPALLLARRNRRCALLARFHHAERRQERSARARYYERLGYEIVSDDVGPRWEGGDAVMLPSGDALFYGHGYRSDYAAAAWLERHAEVPVYPLELRDPHLYHLDTALAFLPNGIVLVCPTALTRQSLRMLEHVRGVRRLIMVSRESAVRFSLNLVAVGNTIVLGAHDHHIEALVEAVGYRCCVVPLRQFHLAGGSAACLVAAVHRDPVE
jgi:N-dimethylarginine dimethylaminohydrolase